MKRIILSIALICAAISANAQHHLQIDDGAGNVSIIQPSATGGTYTLPAGGGTLTVGSTIPDQTGNSGEFLTTDGSNLSWGTPAGSGATISFARKTSDETINSAADASETTMQNDNDLAFTFGANEVWEIDGMILDTASGTGVDMNFDFTGPVGTTLTLHYNGFYHSTAGGFQLNGDGTGMLLALGDIGKLDVQQDRAHSTSIKGLVMMGGTGGTVQFRWAYRSNVNTGRTLTVRSGSYFKATKIQ